MGITCGHGDGVAQARHGDRCSGVDRAAIAELAVEASAPASDCSARAYRACVVRACRDRYRVGYPGYRHGDERVKVEARASVSELTFDAPAPASDRSVRPYRA